MPMVWPVVASDGHSYEQKAIKKWLVTQTTSPVTNALLPDKRLIINHNLLKMIQDHISLASAMAAATAAPMAVAADAASSAMALVGAASATATAAAATPRSTSPTSPPYSPTSSPHLSLRLPPYCV